MILFKISFNISSGKFICYFIKNRYSKDSSRFFSMNYSENSVWKSRGDFLQSFCKKSSLLFPRSSLEISSRSSSENVTRFLLHCHTLLQKLPWGLPLKQVFLQIFLPKFVDISSQLSQWNFYILQMPTVELLW